MGDSSTGFRFRGRRSGGAATIQHILYKDTETLSQGDMINLESGYGDLGATGDTGFIGVLLNTQAGTTPVTLGQVIGGGDALYRGERGQPPRQGAAPGPFRANRGPTPPPPFPKE